MLNDFSNPLLLLIPSRKFGAVPRKHLRRNDCVTPAPMSPTIAVQSNQRGTCSQHLTVIPVVY